MAFKRELMGSVTVWYNPQPDFIQHIHSYSNYSKLVIVVDNSVTSNRNLFDKIEAENKIYIWHGENMGIAKALNLGIATLINQGYKFALTLDQDSLFEQSEIEKLLVAAEKHDWENTGIISPIHQQQKSKLIYNLHEYSPATCVMTSGNILNLTIAEKVGLFNEQLFIDHVDNEYCLRLNKSGYKVLIANAFLIHQLGKYKDVFFLGKRIGGFISHSPERLYYFVRNSMYILRNYFFIDKKYSLMEVTALIKRFLKLFFEGETSKRLKLYFKGVRDYKKLN